MKWINIKSLKDLTICPWCSDTITNELFISKSNRMKLSCNHCDCLMYENSGRLWYKIPDMVVTKTKLT